MFFSKIFLKPINFYFFRIADFLVGVLMIFAIDRDVLLDKNSITTDGIPIFIYMAYPNTIFSEISHIFHYIYLCFGYYQYCIDLLSHLMRDGVINNISRFLFVYKNVDYSVLTFLFIFCVCQIFITEFVWYSQFITR